jgi:uncharacterized integral membrane protein (TIGR00698 family)
MRKWVAGHRETIFLLGLLVAASGVVSTPVALLGGMAFGLTGAHPLRKEGSALSKLLLQISVVLLGFGMNLGQVLRAGRAGAGYTALSIAFAMGLGLLLGRMLTVKGRTTFLITAGTAICGGSAIAALAPVSDASEEEISVSMASVFVLNSVALLLFPLLGAAMHFSQNQFGLWAALAIHDTSSVVGASAKYGAQALQVGTTVKLVRALWIVPLSLLTAAYVRTLRRRGSGVSGSVSRVRLPWFIALFCLASLAGTLLPHLGAIFRTLSGLGRTGLTATLYLIGASLSVASVKEIGMRPLLLAVVLWVVVGTVSALAIHAHLISI